MEASRQFVCVRLATYESKEEAEFMQGIHVGKSGVLENTSFSILSPDGEESLTKSGRGPFYEYRNSGSMARGMKKIAAKYVGSTKEMYKGAQLPFADTLRLGMNMAAADLLPVAVLVAKDAKELSSVSEKLLPVAWSDEIAGQFGWASVVDKRELETISGIDKTTAEGGSILLVAPGQYGLKGKVLKQLAATADNELIKAEMIKVIKEFPRKAKSHDNHVKKGIAEGVDWKSAIPETDPGSVAAKKRMRTKDGYNEAGHTRQGGGKRRGGGPGGAGGPGGRGGGSDRMVEHAMTFDSNGDKQLSRKELKTFVAEFGKMRRGGPPGGGRGGQGQDGPGGRSGQERGGAMTADKMIELAMNFDSNEDSQLSESEFKKFAEDFGQQHAPPPGGAGRPRR